MLSKRRFLMAVVALIALTGVVTRAQPSQAADNLWSVVTAIHQATCFVDAQNQARVQWTYVQDVSVVAGMTNVVKDTLNGQATFQGTILLNVPQTSVTTTGPVWETAPHFPLTYIATARVYSPESHLTSISIYRLTCRKPGRAQVDIWYNKNIWF